MIDIAVLPWEIPVNQPIFEWGGIKIFEFGNVLSLIESGEMDF